MKNQEVVTALTNKIVEMEKDRNEDMMIYNPNGVSGAEFIQNYKGDSKVLQNMKREYDNRPFKGEMPAAYKRVLKQNIIKNQMGTEGTRRFLHDSLDREVNETNNRITNSNFYQLENN